MVVLLQPNPDESYPEPTVGKVLLKMRGMFLEEYWYWISVGALVGFSLLFNLLFVWALTYLDRKPSIHKLKLVFAILFEIDLIIFFFKIIQCSFGRF